MNNIQVCLALKSSVSTYLRVVGAELIFGNGQSGLSYIESAADGNTSSRTITEVKHLELNQFSDG